MPTSPAHPIVGQRCVFALSRAEPLSTEELSALSSLAYDAARRSWFRVDAVWIRALDGFDQWVAALSFRYLTADPELVELPQVADLATGLARAVPGAQICADDPAALFGERDDAIVVAHPLARHIPALPRNWSIPDGAALVGFPPPVRATLPAPTDAAEAQLADLLQALDRLGPEPALLQAGASIALRYAGRLHALMEAGVLESATCYLLGDLSRRDLAVIPDVAETARRLSHDGDTRGRQASTELMASLDRQTGTGTGRAAPGDAEGEPLSVTELGRLTFDALSPPAAEEGAEDWEDDLELDALIIEDDLAGRGQALAEVSRALVQDLAERLPAEPMSPDGVLAHLKGSPEQQAAACLLLAEGRWTHRAVPGVLEALLACAGADQPVDVRRLAARAIGSVNRPDGPAILRVLTADADATVASAAIEALTGIPGGENRALTRAALDRPDVAIAAVRSAVEAADVGAFVRIHELARTGEDDVRSAACSALPILGGARAMASVERAALNDADVVTRLSAFGALARLVGPSTVGRILNTNDIARVVRVLTALGDADRTDCWAYIHTACRATVAEVREAAAQALGMLGLPAATPQLLVMVGDPDDHVATAAIQALARCGDRRSVATLRRLAGRGDHRAVAAAQALRTGRSLRQAAPDGRLRIRAVAMNHLGPDDQRRLVAAFEASGLRLRFSAAGFAADATIDPSEVATLSAVVDAVHRAEAAVADLRWSVRDGLYAIRRTEGRWIVSGRRGAIARDAGWFAEALPAPTDRLPLRPPPRAATPAPAGPVLPRELNPVADGAAPTAEPSKTIEPSRTANPAEE